MVSYIWLTTIQIAREETCCRHIGYSYRLTARGLLYAPSHRQDSTYHSLCCTSRGTLAGTRNSSMGPPHEGSIRRLIAPWANALTTELHLTPCKMGILTNCNCNKKLVALATQLFSYKNPKTLWQLKLWIFRYMTKKTFYNNHSNLLSYRNKSMTTWIILLQT